MKSRVEPSGDAGCLLLVDGLCEGDFLVVVLVEDGLKTDADRRGLVIDYDFCEVDLVEDMRYLIFNRLSLPATEAR